LTDFQKTNNPSHTALSFPTTCDSCHLSDSWAGAKFDHFKLTGFALVGAHATLDCSACHVGGKFNGTPTDCASCHIKDYNRTTNPHHAQAGIPTTCATCHTTIAWSPATFDHSKTVFPLTGAHVNVACNLCHIGGNFANASTDCVSCHIKDFNGTTNPNHVQAGIPTTCVVCHTTTAWSPAIFDHNKTIFPLTGAHINVACNLCHIGGNFAKAATDCASCHIKDYNGTTKPSHAAAGFPTDCSLCHTTTSWAGAVFDHSKTLFPLTGFHVNVACSSCHINNVFAGLATTCVSCHLKDFNAAASPNHVASHFPQSCEICHTTSAWQPSTFDHSKTNFPLTGAHVSVPCTSCHTSSNFAATPTDCYSCHTLKWLSTATLGGPVPNHLAVDAALAGIVPTACGTCHNTTNWMTATFNHTWFPLNHGNNAAGGVCSNCHTNTLGASANYAAFQCTVCHGGNNASSFRHPKEPGYVYNSINCYQCHPTGNNL